MLTLSAQKAKARARQRSRPETTLQLTVAYVVPEPSEEAPFAPPPVDDIFGLGECEDEEEDVEDAPFDPPELEDEPVFTAPVVRAEPAEQPSPPPIPEPPPQTRDRPLPAISIYASWDRPETEALLRELAADPRLARAECEIARGGLDAAASRAQTATIDLFVLETTLDGAAMLSALDRLRAAAPDACVVILGAVNDIGLLRELAARGVSDYIVPPAKAADVARSLCALFAEADGAKTIAVIGARGGIGASTIARNIAWSIAERQQQRTTLVDLDLSFGSAATSFRQEPKLSVSEVLDSEDAEEVLTKALIRPTPKLQLLSAPTKTATLEIDLDKFSTLIANARRTAPFVVLDLPHAWEPWVREALREADEVILVAGPDLASLRNADNILKLLRSERDKPNAPKIVVSMSGLPKRPEIPMKDFAEALRATPEANFMFEPELFGKAEADGQMIYEAMPDAKAALQLDMLAALITGHEPCAKPAPTPEPLPVLELSIPLPAERPRRKQRPVRTGFIALQEPLPAKRRSSGLVRTLAAVATLLAVGVWYVGQHQTTASTPAAVGAFSA